MTATETIKRLGQDLIDMAIAYKEDHVTIEEFREEKIRIILLLPIIIASKKDILDLMGSIGAIIVIRNSYFGIMSKPKPPKNFKGCPAYIRTGEEEIILPDGKLIRTTNPDLNKLPKNIKFNDKNMPPLP